MKKLGWLCVTMSILTMCLGGCGREPGEAMTAAEAGAEATEETISGEAEASPGEDAAAGETVFPENYQRESGSGKVRFDCSVEVPEDIGNKNLPRISVEGLYHCDQEKAWSMFGEGQEIAEKHETQGEDGKAASAYYTFADGGTLSITEGVTYGAGGNRIYSYIPPLSPENMSVLEGGSVSFANAEECIKQVKNAMEELGYQAGDFSFQAFPVDADRMKALEEEYISQELLEEENRKGEWSEADDAWVLYAYQEHNGIPVFHEMMGIARQFADDSPENAAVSAICSARGFESLNISSFIYVFKDEESAVSFKPFEEIAGVVEQRYENLLDESEYEVTKAKLFERVYVDEQQKYASEPVWHFTVVQDGARETVVLVNAETGKEVFLP